MSISRNFILGKMADKKDSNPLIAIQSMISEFGVLPDQQFFKSHNNRKTLMKSNPKSFLNTSPNGTPTFPVRNQYGGLSYTMLKRGIAAARGMYSKTRDEKYLEIISKLEGELRALESRTHLHPIMYKPNTGLIDEVLDKYGKNGCPYKRME